MFIWSCFSAPILDEERKALKNILKSMETQIIADVKWRQTNCNANPELPDEESLKIMLKKMVKILKNPHEHVEKGDIDQIFTKIEEYLDKMVEIMSKMVKCIETYKSDSRFDVAIRLGKVRSIGDKCLLSLRSTLERYPKNEKSLFLCNNKLNKFYFQRFIEHRMRFP